jgi:hypothetical protein
MPVWWYRVKRSVKNDVSSREAAFGAAASGAATQPERSTT